MMIGLTLCSGIGAPEVAAPWVDWRLAAEIEPFPRAVLQARHGYKAPPEHNQGEPLLWSDMTEVTPELLRRHGVPLPDLVVAGTPCQAFSVAGLRKGTEDPRGNLTLTFIGIVHDLAAARPDGRLAALWENVPGVLSDRGNAFGAFLGGLVGADDALSPPDGGSWPDAGMVSGPRARVAWRVLNAQHFGVAQRRRRVFAVIDIGGRVDPAAVLFERKGLRGDTPQGRGAGQVAPTLPARSLGGGGLGTDFDCDGVLIPQVAGTLKACAGKSGQPNGAEEADRLIPVVMASTGDVSHFLNAGGMGRQDYETETLVAHALRGEGFDASEDGTGRGTPLVPVAFDCKAGGDTSFAIGRVAGALRGECFGGGHAAIALPFDTTQITSPGNVSNPQLGDPCHPLAAGGHPPALAFMSNASGANLCVGDDLSPTLRIGGDGGNAMAIAQAWAVRRLTPKEAERLQGFPDAFTDVPWRGKEGAPDGPRYKALGNSMAVPCVAWIMERMRLSMEAAP